jgi:hypothetical protein
MTTKEQQLPIQHIVQHIKAVENARLKLSTVMHVSAIQKNY